MAFPHIRQPLASKMIDDLTHGHQQAITDCDNRIQAINYQDMVIQGKTLAKYQEIAAFQKFYVGCFTNEDKNNGITIIAKNDEVAG